MNAQPILYTGQTKFAQTLNPRMLETWSTMHFVNYSHKAIIGAYEFHRCIDPVLVLICSVQNQSRPQGASKKPFDGTL